MKPKLLLTLLVLSAIILTACTACTPACEDIEWVLESYGEEGNLQPALEGNEPTTKFDSAEGQVTGSTGCNHYFGAYEINKDKLSIGPMAQTEMWCEGLMDQEQECLTILQAAESYQITGGKLEISSGANRLIFKRK